MKRLIVLLVLGLFLFSYPASPVLAGNPPDQGHSSLSANTSPPADGQTQATVTVTLNDSSGNPVVGDNVTLSDPGNSSAVINTTSGTTNSSGQATFTITSTNASTDNLTITDTTSNSTFSNFGQVTFNTAPTPTPTPPGYCSDSSPGSSPQLTSAVAQSSSKITLTWTDASDPVSYYLISYGTTSGQYIYGNPNVGNQGTTSYTVGSLSPNRTYYFVVEAVHGCAPGSKSNELSATTDQIILPTRIPTSVPTDTPSPTLPPLPTTLPPTPTDQPASPTQTLNSAVEQLGSAKWYILILVPTVMVASFLIWKKSKS